MRQGQREGSIREEADPLQTAWMLVSRAWTEDITHLMGLSGEWDEERSNRMLDLILDEIEVTPSDGPGASGGAKTGWPRSPPKGVRPESRSTPWPLSHRRATPRTDGATTTG